MNLFASVFGKIAELLGTGASSACIWFTWDEPECPDELL